MLDHILRGAQIYNTAKLIRHRQNKAQTSEGGFCHHYQEDQDQHSILQPCDKGMRSDHTVPQHVWSVI
jgi:hypothetical protein